MITPEKIQQIKDAADIVEVIGDFVKLKKRGANYIGLSPFTNERTPSFHVSTSKLIFKDFSSGNGGDVIEFLMKSQNWRYIDAIKYIAKRYNIEVENNDFEYTPIFKEPALVVATSYIDMSEVDNTLSNYDGNSLYEFLSDKFGYSVIYELFKKYCIGIDHTNTYTKQYIIFWLIDTESKVRSGKYIKYQDNGRRDKESKASWHHVRTKEYQPIYPNFNLVQCFFGEHLIKGNIKPIAIVESEKTAVIASLFIDKYIWLACGSKNGLGDIKCSILDNRSVTLFPDLGAFDEWKIIANKHHWSISDHVEKIANDTDRAKGLDLADYLLRN